jgi:TRAP-type C4-dicarboxylate transport system permease small subunit
MPITRIVLRVNQVAQFASSVWVVCLAVIILVDVAGRGFFNVPFKGAPEIIGNSIALMAFLQAPHAISLRAMLRAELIDGWLSPAWRRALNALCYVLGVLLFAALCYSGIEPTIHAWNIGEYEGEGALRVPTYPVRIGIVFLSALAALNYLLLLLNEIGIIPSEELPAPAHDIAV